MTQSLCHRELRTERNCWGVSVRPGQQRDTDAVRSIYVFNISHWRVRKPSRTGARLHSFSAPVYPWRVRQRPGAARWCRRDAQWRSRRARRNLGGCFPGWDPRCHQTRLWGRKADWCWVSELSHTWGARGLFVSCANNTPDGIRWNIESKVVSMRTTYLALKHSAFCPTV